MASIEAVLLNPGIRFTWHFSFPLAVLCGLQTIVYEHPEKMEKEMVTLSAIFAWRIPWTEEPGRLYSPWGRKESDRTGRLKHAHTHLLRK